MSISGSTLTIRPSSTLPGPVEISVDIDAGAIEDTAGNGVAAFDGTGTLAFVTLDPSALLTNAPDFDTTTGTGIEGNQTTNGSDQILVIADPLHLTPASVVDGGGGSNRIVLDAGGTYAFDALAMPLAGGFDTLEAGGGDPITAVVDGDSGLDDFTTYVGRSGELDRLVSSAPATDLTAASFSEWDSVRVSSDDAVLTIDAGVLANVTDFISTAAGSETLTGNLGSDVDLTGRDLSGFEVIENTANGDTTLRLDGATQIGDVTEIGTGDTAGMDTIETSASTLDLSGVTLNRFDRLVTTNAAGSTLVASAGEQAVIGAAGDDDLAGGDGTDTLTGDHGADTFRGDPGELDGDTITDFTSDDRIVVTGAAPQAGDGAFLEFDATGDQPLTLDTDTPAADTFDAADTTIDLPGAPDIGFQVSTSGGNAVVRLNAIPQADPGDTPLTTDENTNTVFTAADFGFVDTDGGDSLEGVRITSLPANGTLFVDGNGNGVPDPGEAVEVDDVIARAAIDAGDLQYMPPGDIDGSLTANLGIEVGDGQAYSGAATVTIEATGVNEAPVVNAPPDLEIDAAGLYTRVDLERDGSAVANDEEQGALPATPAGGGLERRLPPGTHTIEWSATDGAGQSDTDTQTVDVRPRVGIGPDRMVQEGTTVEIPVELNGDAIDGTTPTIHFDVADTSTASSGDYAGLGVADNVTMGTGTRTAAIGLDIVDDATPEGPQTLVLELTATGGDTVLAGDTRTTITIVEDNVAPRVSLTAQQGGNDPAVVIDGTAGASPVTVTAETVDRTDTADMDIRWNGAAIGLSDLDTDADPATFEFDPTVVAPGVYPLEVTATDHGTPAESASALLRLRVTDDFPALGGGDTDGDGIDDDDPAEGRADRDGDGLPDYRDPYPDASTLQQSPADAAGFRLETEPGLELRLGPVAFDRDVPGARLTPGDIAAVLGPRDDRDNVGGHFGFEIAGLPVPGAAADVVIPQRERIPPQPVYRKVGPSGGWFDFVARGGAALASAPGTPGFCPPPDDPAYTTGLSEGDWCVRLTLVDGGPNDGDGRTNGRIVDPGGVATTAGDGGAEASSGGGAAGLGGLLLIVVAGLAGPVVRGRRTTA